MTDMRAERYGKKNQICDNKNIGDYNISNTESDLRCEFLSAINLRNSRVFVSIKIY